MRNFLSLQRRMFSKTVPSVSFDVDGVLKVGNISLPNAKEAVIKLRERNVPISLITNGGGELELKRGERISSIIGINDQKYRFKQEEVFLCHTPMKELYQKFKDKLILIAGLKSCSEVIESYGFTNYMTVEEYSVVFDDLVPFFFSIFKTNEEKFKIIDRVSKRIKKTFQSGEYAQVHAIFMMTDVSNWEINAQVCADLLSSKDGIPGSVRSESQAQFVEFHAGSDDLLYKDTFKLPRYGAGAFITALKPLVRNQHKLEFLYTLYGKPSNKIFDCARKSVLDRNKDRKISKFYMIGDNPHVDIQGANNSNFTSILVRTGVFEGGANSIDHPANYVVNDVNEAVDLILKIENLL